MGHYRVPTTTDCDIDRRNVQEIHSDITRKMKVDVPSFDEKIHTTTFSDRLIAMEDRFDWYEMYDIERVRFAKMKIVEPAMKFWKTVINYLKGMY